MRRPIALGAGLLLAACAADFGGPINSNPQGVPPREARLMQLEERLGELTRKVEALTLSARAQDTQRLEAELRGLRGDIERLRYDIDTNEKRNRQLYQDLDRRIQKIENEGRPARLQLEPKIASVPPPAADAEEESTYLQVFDQLKAGKYDEAIAGFQGMLDRWPDGRYADNALYWMGESHYVKRDYEKAIATFRQLQERFGDSPKVPDALLKTALAQIELKKPDEARATLQKIVSAHPNSSAANIAKQRLEQLK